MSERLMSIRWQSFGKAWHGPREGQIILPRLTANFYVLASSLDLLHLTAQTRVQTHSNSGPLTVDLDLPWQSAL